MRDAAASDEASRVTVGAVLEATCEVGFQARRRIQDLWVRSCMLRKSGFR